MKNKSKIEKLIVCISSNNFQAFTSLQFLSSIFKSLHDKFPVSKVFICLAGICSSINESSAKSLETLNNSIREKSPNAVIINPPDNFITTDGHTFTEDTKKDFYKSLNSFLC